MKVKIWGSRGSLPASFTSEDFQSRLVEVVKSASNKKFASDADIVSFVRQLPSSLKEICGTNTSCVEIETGRTNEYLICDSGTGLRDFSNNYVKAGGLKKPARFHIILTHLHWDHIQGFPFFSPIYVPGNEIIIHGYHPEIEHLFRMQMRPPCFPVPFEGLDSKIIFDIKPAWESFDICDFKVRSIQQNHPGISFGYRFEKEGKAIVYSTDCEHTENANENGYPFIEFFKDADLLIFDAMYSMADSSTRKVNWGHSNNFMAVNLSARAKVKRLLLFHHEPARNEKELSDFLENTIVYSKTYHEENKTEWTLYPQLIDLARDGMEIEV